MVSRRYVIQCYQSETKRRAVRLGKMEVVVPEEVIALRGEREAVAYSAWKKLMGQNELGEDIDKNSPTREILMTEIWSRYEAVRGDVYQRFYSSIKFSWVGVVHG